MAWARDSLNPFLIVPTFRLLRSGVTGRALPLIVARGAGATSRRLLRPGLPRANVVELTAPPPAATAVAPIGRGPPSADVASRRVALPDPGLPAAEAPVPLALRTLPAAAAAASDPVGAVPAGVVRLSQARPSVPAARLIVVGRRPTTRRLLPGLGLLPVRVARLLVRTKRPTGGLLAPTGLVPCPAVEEVIARARLKA